MYIAVVGGPAVGKTEFARNLGREIEADVVLAESGNIYLPSFCMNQRSFAFHLQVSKIIERVQLGKEAITCLARRSVVQDGWIQEVRGVYAPLLLANEHLSLNELQMLEDLCRGFEDYLALPDLVIQLFSKPVFAAKKIREGEKKEKYIQDLTVYLASLNEQYEVWLKSLSKTIPVERFEIKEGGEDYNFSKIWPSLAPKIRQLSRKTA